MINNVVDLTYRYVNHFMTVEGPETTRQEGQGTAAPPDGPPPDGHHQNTPL
jgi:hypothetical protein